MEADLQQWLGRSEERTDVVRPVSALAATLDREDPGLVLPPLWHWTLFPQLTPQSGIGPDGHALRGGFLPPVPLPRRMWAGGRLDFLQPLRIGDQVRRLSRVAGIRSKLGRRGELVFVTVRHQIFSSSGLALTEEHDIVYRGMESSPAAPLPAPDGALYEREIVPDPVLLFRYSALTFNGHRIHYDRSYATGVEGYPGLVVHGPLIATLLLDLLHRHRPEVQVRRFQFKAVRPLFDTQPFFVCGRPDGNGFALWARDTEGYLAMEASAT
jgi:3-methylfumaryl-CoA hydratase